MRMNRVLGFLKGFLLEKYDEFGKYWVLITKKFRCYFLQFDKECQIDGDEFKFLWSIDLL